MTRLQISKKLSRSKGKISVFKQRAEKSSSEDDNDDDTFQTATFFENLDEFCKQTTLHGLKFIGDRKIWSAERIFFLIVVILAFALCTGLILRTYDKWSLSPVIVGLEPALDFISSIPFPAITICNANRVLRSKAVGLDNTTLNNLFLKRVCNAEVDSSEYKHLNDSNSWPMFREFLMQNTPSCDKTFVFCRIGLIYVPCRELFRPILTDAGICCTFNTLQEQFMYTEDVDMGFYISPMSQPGFVDVNWTMETGYPKNLPKYYSPRAIPYIGNRLGLSIVLNAQADEYYCSSTNGVAFKASLHSPAEIPKISNHGFIIPIGHENRYLIHPLKSDASERLRSVNARDRQCRFQSENNLTFFQIYSRTNCEMECEARAMLDRCKCVEFFMPKIVPDVKICEMKDKICTRQTHIDVKRRINWETDCTDQCMPSCFELGYTAEAWSVMMAKDNSFLMRSNVMERFNRSIVRKNMAVAHFYYAENTFRASKKELFIGMTDFISNTGGLLGLFSGFSVITLIEIVYFMTLRPYFARRKFKRLQKLHQPDLSIKTISSQNKHFQPKVKESFEKALQHFNDDDGKITFPYTN